MKAISLTQPWASLLAHGAKHIETRSWRTDHRGWTAIHASKGFPVHVRELCHLQPFARALEGIGIKVLHYKDDLGSWSRVDHMALPLGAVLAVGNLHKVERITSQRSDGGAHIATVGLPITGDELDFGDYTPGRYAGVFTNVCLLPRPIPATGKLGLWDWQPPAELIPWLRERGIQP